MAPGVASTHYDTSQAQSPHRSQVAGTHQYNQQQNVLVDSGDRAPYPLSHYCCGYRDTSSGQQFTDRMDNREVGPVPVGVMNLCREMVIRSDLYGCGVQKHLVEFFKVLICSFELGHSGQTGY